MIVLSTILLLFNSIAFSATSSVESDSIKFSNKEAKKLLKFAKKGELCDSLITEYEKQIQNYKSGIGLKDEQILLSEKLIQSQSNEINKQSKQIKWLKFGIIGLSTACFIELILIVKK